MEPDPLGFCSNVVEPWCRLTLRRLLTGPGTLQLLSSQACLAGAWACGHLHSNSK